MIEMDLSQEQIEKYNDDGYLVIPSFLTSDELDNLRRNSQKILKEFDTSDIKIFTTDKQNDVLDQYFLDSAENVSCFFEENAFDEEGRLNRKKELAINKVGHAMHDLEPECEKVSYSNKIYTLLKSIGIEDPILVQSQYIFKQPRIGAEVHAHTDSTFIYTEPLTCIAIWMAMEDATVENGCLCIIPGSHKTYPLQQKYTKTSDGKGTEFHDTPFERVNWDLTRLTALEVKKGDLVLMHGEVVHASYQNKSEKSRHSFILHAVDANAKWPKDNWLQRSSELPFRKMKDVVDQIN